MKPLRLILAAVTALILAFIVVRSRQEKPGPPPARESTAPTNAPAAAMDTQPTPVTEISTTVPASQVAPAMASEESDDPAKPVILEIYQALQAGGLTNLQTIVPHLRDPEPRIRKTALMALKAADDRRIIPEMQAIADDETDPTRRADIVEVIKFLELPSFAEATETARTNRPAPATPTQ